MNKKGLDELSREMPTSQQLSDITEACDTMPARAVALILTAFIDNLLERCIQTHFVPLSNARLIRLFRSPQAPIGTFSSKIAISYALGIISDDHRACLDRLRSIRNAFAHAVKDIEFETEEIKAECLKIDMNSITRKTQWVPSKDDARERFTSSAMLCGGYLLEYLRYRKTSLNLGLSASPAPFVGKFG